MLGLFPEAEYSSVEIKIGRGDRCLLYTDGVFEASNAAREEFGKITLQGISGDAARTACCKVCQ